MPELSLYFSFAGGGGVKSKHLKFSYVAIPDGPMAA